LIFCVPIPAYLVYNWRLKRSFCHTMAGALSSLGLIATGESARSRVCSSKRCHHSRKRRRQNPKSVSMRSMLRPFARSF
jgi:hypothetical protein